MKTTLKLSTLLMTLMTCVPVFADDSTYADSAASIQTDSSVVQKNSLGLGLVYAQNIYDGVGNKVQPFPLFNLSYDDFFLQGVTAGYNFYNDPELSFAWVVQPQFGGYNSDDSNDLEGMRDTSYLINTGAQVQYRLLPFSFSLAALHDITGRSAGNSAIAKVAVMVPLEDKQLELIPSISMSWEDSDITNYYYGVSQGESTSSRPAYDPGTAVNVNYGLTLKYRLSEHWGATIGYMLTQYADDIADSPIVSRKYASAGLAGVSYIF